MHREPLVLSLPIAAAAVRLGAALSCGALLFAALGLVGCGGDNAPTPPRSADKTGAIAPRSPLPAGDGGSGGSGPTAPPAPASSPTPPPLVAGTAKERPVVVFLGDSITAGLGLSAEEAWPALVSEQLAAAGTPIRAVNAGVSGDTSAGGLRRLDWLLRQRPDVVVVELGANDGLRGQPVAGVEANLRAIVERSQAAGARVLLLGLRMPPSLGGDYARQFAAVYPRLARELGVPLVPFMLEGVAGNPELNLPDGIHPNAEGQRRVAALVRPHLERVLSAPAAAAAR